MVELPVRHCQYMGPGVHPRNYPVGEVPMCGHSTVPGTSYCSEHYHRIFIKGTALAGGARNKLIEKELAELEKLAVDL